MADDFIEAAVRRFEEKDNCAQALFSTFAQGMGLDEETCLNLSQIFSGGVSRSGNVCGAITGGLMAISLKYGKSGKTESSKRDAPTVYELGERFMNKFKHRNGTLLCKDLIGYDISTEEKLRTARDNKAFSKCSKFVHDAAEILANIL
ncbi:MAG: C-GCAxxG-C-C family protein [Candidatus Heimdallarchaeota archaeon]